MEADPRPANREVGPHRANKLSHERRWYRGSFEEWEERKALKLAAQKKRVPDYPRFQAYRKGEVICVHCSTIA